MERSTTKVYIWYAIAVVIGVVLSRDVWVQQSHVDAIPYSEFRTLLQEGKIAEVGIGQEQIVDALQEPTGEQKSHFVTGRVEPTLAESLAKYDVNFFAQPESGLLKGLERLGKLAAAIKREIGVGVSLPAGAVAEVHPIVTAGLERTAQ